MALKLARIDPLNALRGMRGITKMMATNDLNIARVEAASLDAVMRDPSASTTSGELILGKTITSVLFRSLMDMIEPHIKRTVEFLKFMKSINKLSASA